MTATPEAVSLSLVRLGPAQVREALALRNACADDLTRRCGLGPWSPHGHLPTARHQTRHKHVLGARRRDRLVAVMTLSTEPPLIHELEWFADPEAEACYLTGLYVLPELQGQGIGRWMMVQADETARQWNCVALRFDAYVGPAGAVPFYRRLGYESRGEHQAVGVRLEVFERLF